MKSLLKKLFLLYHQWMVSTFLDMSISESLERVLSRMGLLIIGMHFIVKLSYMKSEWFETTKIGLVTSFAPFYDSCGD